MDLHDTAMPSPGNADRLADAHAFALGMTYAALCRGEDAPPLSEEEFELATMEPSDEEREGSGRIIADALMRTTTIDEYHAARAHLRDLGYLDRDEASS